MHYFSTQIAWRSWTSLWGYPMIYRILYIPGGAGFLPSTAWILEPRFFGKKSREKLQDNVFVAVHVMVQHTISASSAEAALYKLDDISEQLDSYVYLGSHENFSTSTFWLVNPSSDVYINPGKGIPVIRGWSVFFSQKNGRGDIGKVIIVKSQLTLQSETCWSCIYVKAKGILLKNLAFPCGWELWESDLPFETIGDSNWYPNVWGVFHKPL